MDSHHSTGDIPRLDYLDALRGIAACWVVVFHVIFIPKPNLAYPKWAWLATIGGMGVTLFFVVSAVSLCHTRHLHAGERSPTLSFYMRRFFRIAPLFYAMLFFYYWRDIVMFNTAHSGSEIFSNVFFIFNIIPGFQEGYVWASWTIGVEMLFYLSFPFIVRHVDNIAKAAALVLACIVLSRLMQFAIDYFIADVARYNQYTIARHLPIFAMGILAFHVGAALRARQSGWSLGLALIMASLAILIALIEGRVPLLTSYQWQGAMFATFLLGLMFAPIRIAVNPVSVFLGKISYSLYLIHPTLVYLLMPIYRKIYEFPMPLSAKYSASIALTMGLLVPISYLSYCWIERPGIQLGKMVLSRGRFKAAPAPAE